MRNTDLIPQRLAVAALLEPLEARVLLSSAYIQGTWKGTESVNYTIHAMGQSDSGQQSGSDDVFIHQQGNKVWYERSWSGMGNSGTVTRTGTISGNHVTFSGPFVVLAPGVNVTSNICRIEGDLVGNTMRLTGTGSAAGDYQGTSFTVDGTSKAVLTRPAVPIAAKFVWSMPDRYGVDTNHSGLIDLPNSYEYVNPSGYVVNLDASSSSCGLPLTKYDWTVEGNGLAKAKTASGKRAAIKLTQGRYNVTLKVTADNGQTDSITQKILVRDILMVAIGDSYASGEGNPEVPGPGHTALWADGVTALSTTATTMTNENREAHRSTWCASSRAALQLERNAPDASHFSVTFVLLAESGATVDKGLLGPATGTEKHISLPGQLAELRQIAGKRKIDVLTLSIGGNDIGFAQRTADLVGGEPLTDIQAALNPAIADLPNHYARLNKQLKTFQIAHTIITEYPDPTHNQAGKYAPFADDFVSGKMVSADGARFAYERMLVPLNYRVQEAATKWNWEFCTGIASDFLKHGYAATPTARWFVTEAEARLCQGCTETAAGIFPISTGGLHPNIAGHRDIAGRLRGLMDPDIEALLKAGAP